MSPSAPRRRSSSRLLAAGAIAAASLAASANASVLYVRSSATGANTGLSWADAYTDLQTALAAAAPGDQIWVAAGTYRPAAAGASRESAFALRPGIALYGGFAGSEATLDQRNWTANPTILSGDLAADDAPQFANRADNCYQVVIAIGAAITTTSVLDGFTIAGGYADGVSLGPTPASKDQGSGLNVYDDAAPRIANCTFRDNWAINHGTINDHGHCTVVNCTFRDNASNGHGAGLYIHHHSLTTATGCSFINNAAGTDGAGVYIASMDGAAISNCTFSGNTAGRGAGLYLAVDAVGTITNCQFTGNQAEIGGGGIYSDFASPTITACTFHGNSAGIGATGGSGGEGGSGGAGVWLSSTGQIRDCTFTDNSATFGAGVYCKELGNPTISNCTFTGNAANEGGGLYTLFTDALVTGCTFTANSATDGAFSVGGGVSVYFANATVTNCTFSANTASVGGAALYTEGESATITGCTMSANAAIGGSNCCGSDGWGGGIMFGYFSTATIANCAITDNSADLGGAVFAISLTGPRLINCTMTRNRAALGAATYGFAASGATYTNCILWGNTGPAGQTPAVQVVDQDTSITTINHSIVQGGWPGAGAAILNADPRFIDGPAGDLRLRPGSPAIDGGDSSALPTAITTDLAGAPRRRNDPGMPDRGVGAPPLVDLGAHEFQGTTCRADWDGNATIDPADIALFVAQWFAGLTSGDHSADFDLNGVLLPSDVSAMVNAWFTALTTGC